MNHSHWNLRHISETNTLVQLNPCNSGAEISWDPASHWEPCSWALESPATPEGKDLEAKAKARSPSPRPQQKQPPGSWEAGLWVEGDPDGTQRNLQPWAAQTEKPLRLTVAGNTPLTLAPSSPWVRLPTQPRWPPPSGLWALPACPHGS